MIIAEELRKQFGDFQAVKGISLSVSPGEVLALLGPNGAGKTTTIRMLSAILKPTSGRAIIGGFDVLTQPREVRHAVGLLTEFPGLYHRMRGLDYLLFFGRLQGVDDRTCLERAERLMKRFDLWQARERRLDGYSKGMKQKIALIRAMIHDPNILFLDEPTTAMDPHSARTVRDAIGDLRNEQRTIILCTHNLVEAETLADRIAIIRDGGITAQGSLAQLSQQLLGHELWELRLTQPLPGLRTLIEDLVQVERASDELVLYSTEEPAEVNAVVLRRVLDRGGLPLGLTRLERTLEDVYLQIIGATAGERIVGTDGEILEPEAAEVLS